MGWLDKLLGRTKKAAGDITGDSSMRREGEHQEHAPGRGQREDEHDENRCNEHGPANA